MNVSDSNHQFARGIQDRFGLNGEIPREIVLVSAANLWYWTNAQPGTGWNSLTKWSLASWKPSPTVANYGSAPWGNINGWQDTKAKWIWWDPNAATSTSVGSTWFRTTFTLPVSASIGIEATADDSFTLYIDGKHILAGNNWSTRYYNTTSLGAGVYALAVAANNAQGAAGVIASVRDLATGNVIFRTDASVGSYTNFYRYDLWGNLIYSRSAISPAANWYHENFNSYYNDGLQPGFNAFQDTFSQIQGTSPDNPWSVQGGLWQVQSGVGFMDNNFTSGWTRIQGTGSFTTNGDVGVMVNGVTGVGEQWGKGVPGSLNTSMFTRITVRFASDSGINPSVNVLYTDSTFDAFTLAGGTGQGKYQVQSFTLIANKIISSVRLATNSNINSKTAQWDYVTVANEIAGSQWDNLGQYSGTETTGQQEANFAWANITRSDLSLQANVFITKQVNASDQRVGIFVHHSTANYKWMLVLHNTGSGIYLEITDEFYGTWPPNGDPGMVSCPLNYGKWYTFNMTVHGLLVTGWAAAPGMTTCNVWRYFSSQSPAYGGTGFGLYAGGYNARFDNVTVTTVSPSITGAGFSNSFISGGAPSPTLHTSLAGSAQLQNGTGTTPIESYYSYYNWGGLFKQQNRYDPPGLAIDGSAGAWCGHDTNSCSTSFSTSRANDIVIVYTLEALDLKTNCTFSVSDTAGLLWTARSAVVWGNGGRDQIQEFYAKSTSPLSSDTITE